MEGSGKGPKRFPHNLMEKIVLMRRPLFLKPLILYPTLLIAAYLIWRTERVPLTGRRRLKPIPDSIAIPFFEIIDAELLEQLEPSILPKHTREHRLIERIVDRYKESQAAFCRQLAEEQDDDRMQEYNLALDKLKFCVVADPEPNAACTGGGLIVVNTGLIELMQYNPDSIAIVIGHEIGHYVAQHTNEAIGHSLLALILNKGVSALFGREHASPFFQSMLDVFYMLPRSRSCETEADFIGLVLAARACFNITNAQQVWLRLVQHEAFQLAAAEGRRMTEEDVEAVLTANAERESLSTHPMFKSRLLFYSPDSEWMQMACQIQHSSCGCVVDSPTVVESPLSRWLHSFALPAMTSAASG